jgi:hypothetical protein
VSDTRTATSSAASDAFVLTVAAFSIVLIQLPLLVGHTQRLKHSAGPASGPLSVGARWPVRTTAEVRVSSLA